MKTYDNYFDTYRHIEAKDPESFVWMNINSTGLAEIMEMAEVNGYTYALDCYDEVVDLCGDYVNIHRRTMVFTRRK